MNQQASDRATDQSQQETEAIRFRPGELRSMSARELAIRFAFGAGVSLLAAIISTLAGPRIGGLFLAFPAILLATLTLMARKDGLTPARDDARGAGLGTLGLIAFALVAAALLPRWHPAVALVAATLAWAVVSGAAYLAIRLAGVGGDKPR
jgi:uncharacterized membrane protein (GlpM family)